MINRAVKMNTMMIMLMTFLLCYWWQRWRWIHCLALIVWESIWNADRREIDDDDADLDDDDDIQHYHAYYDDNASAAGDNDDGNYNDEDEDIGVGRWLFEKAFGMQTGGRMPAPVVVSQCFPIKTRLAPGCHDILVISWVYLGPMLGISWVYLPYQDRTGSWLPW